VLPDLNANSVPTKHILISHTQLF